MRVRTYVQDALVASLDCRTVVEKNDRGQELPANSQRKGRLQQHHALSVQTREARAHARTPVDLPSLSSSSFFYSHAARKKREWRKQKEKKKTDGSSFSSENPDPTLELPLPPIDS